MSIDKYFIHFQDENKSRDKYKPYRNEGGLGPAGQRLLTATEKEWK